MHIETSRDELSPARRAIYRADVWLALIVAVALAVLVLLGETAAYLQPARVALGLAGVLFIPGYAVTAALFPRADDLGTAERIGLSFGTSVALVPALALLLDRLPWGIRPLPILIAESIVTLIGLAAALWRRSAVPAPYSGSPGSPRLPAGRRPVALLAAATALLALGATWLLLTPSSDGLVTEFYVLGADGQAEAYPSAAVAGEPLSMTVGIANRESVIHRYRIEVWSTDPWDPGQRTLLANDGPLTLEPEESEERSLSWSMPAAGDDRQIDLLLFVGDGDEPYRRLRLWLDVTE